MDTYNVLMANASFITTSHLMDSTNDIINECSAYLVVYP